MSNRLIGIGDSVAAIDELYQQFDIERYGAPGQKKEVLI